MYQLLFYIQLQKWDQKRAVFIAEKRQFFTNYIGEFFFKPHFCLARFLDNLLDRDECSVEDGEERETASPTIFTEACTNGNYAEVNRVPFSALRWSFVLFKSPSLMSLSTGVILWIVLVRSKSDCWLCSKKRPRGPTPPRAIKTKERVWH